MNEPLVAFLYKDLSWLFRNHTTVVQWLPQRVWYLSNG